MLLSLGIVLFAGIVLGIIVGANRYLTSQKAEQTATVSCPMTFARHTVKIHGDKLMPSHTDGTLCDTLTIINDDARLRLIAFGRHDRHEPYDGVTEKVLSQRQALTVTMNQTGTYLFHDHLDDAVAGTFTATARSLP